MTSGRYQSSCKTAASGIVGVGVVQQRHESAPEPDLNHLHSSQQNSGSWTVRLCFLDKYIYLQCAAFKSRLNTFKRCT